MCWASGQAAAAALLCCYGRGRPHHNQQLPPPRPMGPRTCTCPGTCPVRLLQRLRGWLCCPGPQLPWMSESAAAGRHSTNSSRLRSAAASKAHANPSCCPQAADTHLAVVAPVQGGVDLRLAVGADLRVDEWTGGQQAAGMKKKKQRLACWLHGAVQALQHNKRPSRRGRGGQTKAGVSGYADRTVLVRRQSSLPERWWGRPSGTRDTHHTSGRGHGSRCGGRPVPVGRQGARPSTSSEGLTQRHRRAAAGASARPLTSRLRPDEVPSVPRTPDRGPERPSSPCDSIFLFVCLFRNQGDTRRVGKILWVSTRTNSLFLAEHPGRTPRT